MLIARIHMSAFSKKAFSEESKLCGAGFRYGFLALILALFVMHTFDSSAPHYWRGFIVPLMLLSNHLAFQFHWSRPSRIALRIWAYLWIVFGSIVIFYDFVRKS